MTFIYSYFSGHTTPVYIYYSSLGLSFYCILAWCVITWHIQLIPLCHCHSITLFIPIHYHMIYIDCRRLGFEPCSSLHYFLILPYTYYKTTNVYHIVLLPFHTYMHLLTIIWHVIPLLYLYFIYIYILYYAGHTVWLPIYVIYLYFPWYSKLY